MYTSFPIKAYLHAGLVADTLKDKKEAAPDPLSITLTPVYLVGSQCREFYISRPTPPLSSFNPPPPHCTRHGDTIDDYPIQQMLSNAIKCLSDSPDGQADFSEDILTCLEYAYIAPGQRLEDYPDWQCINLGETSLHGPQKSTGSEYYTTSALSIEQNHINGNSAMGPRQGTLQQAVKVSRPIPHSASNQTFSRSHLMNTVPKGSLHNNNHHYHHHHHHSKQNQVYQGTNQFHLYGDSSANIKKRKSKKDYPHTYDCDHCSYWSNRLGNIKRHLKTHDKSNDKPKCNICNKPFSSKFNVRRHTSANTNSCKAT